MNFLKNHKTFFIVLALSLAVFFSTVGFWAGLHMKFNIHQFVKNKIGLELKMGTVYVNPFTGNGFIKDIRIENPPGYMAKNAFFISEIRFEGNRNTFHGESIALDHLLLKEIEINFEPKSDNNNFQQLYFEASKYYNSNGLGSDEWFKPLSIGLLNIDPITINLGPKLLNKKMVLEAVELDGLVGDMETPFTYRDFREIVIGRYVQILKKSLGTGSLNEEIKQKILYWINLWENTHPHPME